MNKRQEPLFWKPYNEQCPNVCPDILPGEPRYSRYPAQRPTPKPQKPLRDENPRYDAKVVRRAINRCFWFGGLLLTFIALGLDWGYVEHVHDITGVYAHPQIFEGVLTFCLVIFPIGAGMCFLAWVLRCIVSIIRGD